MDGAAGVVAGVPARAGDAAVEDAASRSRRRAASVPEVTDAESLRLAAVVIANDGGVRAATPPLSTASVFSQPSGIDDGFRNTT